MLNKATHILLSLYFLTTIVGFTVTKHSCGSSIFSVEIESTDNCSCGADCDMSCGMCDIETQYLHLGVDFVLENVQQANIPQSLLPVFSNTISNISKIELHINNVQINSSPPIILLGTRLALIQSFRC